MLALRHVNDRLLKDIGVYRNGIGYDFRRLEWSQLGVREIRRSPPIHPM
jgi:hypothetical protein